ncbi:MAG: hypothetical protein ACI30X_07135 [Muribaculaceae bacterium]
MTVAELIEELKKMPQNETVIMFDDMAYYTPSRVFIWQGDPNEKDKKKSYLNGKVIID